MGFLRHIMSVMVLSNVFAFFLSTIRKCAAMQPLLKRRNFPYTLVYIAFFVLVALSIPSSADAAPRVVATSFGSNGTNATSTTITLPSGVQTGDLLMVFFTKDGTAAPTSITGTGWNTLTGASTGASYYIAYWKIANGSDSLRINHASEGTSNVAYRITGHYPSNPIAQGTPTGGQDAPSLNPSTWGYEDALWIATVSWDGSAFLSAYPSLYFEARVNGLGSTNGGGTAVAARALYAASEDPPTANVAAASRVSQTYAVRPATTTVSVSGTVYRDAAGSQTASGATVKLVIGTTTPSTLTTTTNGSGQYTFTGVPSYRLHLPIAAFVDASTTLRAYTASRLASTTANHTNLNLYRNVVAIDPGGSGGGVDYASLSLFDSTDDADIQFTASTTRGSFWLNDGMQLYIATSSSLWAPASTTIHEQLRNNGNFIGSQRLTLKDGASVTNALVGTSSIGVIAALGSNNRLAVNASTTGFAVSSGAQLFATSSLEVNGGGTIAGTVRNIGTTTMQVNNAFNVYSRTVGDNFSLTARDSVPQGVVMSRDGRKMLMLGSSGDNIYEFNLSTPFEVDTATYVDSFSISTQEAQGLDIDVSDDGLSVFVLGTGNDAISQYLLSAPFDISTAIHYVSFSVATQVGDPRSFDVTQNGARILVAGVQGSTQVFRYDLLVPNDLLSIRYVNAVSISGTVSSPDSIAVNADGSAYHVLNGSTDIVYSFPMTTPYTPSSVSNYNFSITSIESIPTDIAFTPSGNRLLVLGDNTTDRVTELILGRVATTTLAVSSSGSLVNSNLSFRGGLYQLVGNATSTGDVTIASGATLSAGGSLTIGDDFLSSGAFTASTSNVRLTGTASVSGVTTFNDLTVPGTVTLTATTTVTDLTISGAFTAPPTLTIRGDYTNRGTFTDASGHIIFAGTSPQVATGTLSGTSNFNTVTVTNRSGSGSGTQSLTIGADMDVLGTMSFYASTSAAVAPGATLTATTFNTSTSTVLNPVWLVGATPGADWYIDTTGSLGAVFVRDSDACASPLESENGRNLGNNQCWVFDITTFTLSGTLYASDRTTPITTQPIVKLFSQGLLGVTATTTVAANGTFTLTPQIASLTEEEILLHAFVDSNPGITAVTLGTTIPATTTNFNLYADTVSIDSRLSAPVIVADLDTADSARDADIPYTVTGSASTTRLTLGDDTSLYVAANTTFIQFASTTIDGSLWVDGDYMTIGTTTFTGAGVTLGGNLAASSSLDDVTIRGSVTLADAATTSTVFVATGATFTLDAPLTVGRMIQSGTLDVNSSTVYLAGEQHYGRLTFAGGAALHTDTQQGLKFSFSSDGLRYYEKPQSSASIIQYDLTAPWVTSGRVSAGSYNLGVTSSGSFTISPDGTKLFLPYTNGIREYSLSTPWDVTSATYITVHALEGFWYYDVTFTTDGLGAVVSAYDGYWQMAFLGHYELSAPYDLSPATLMSTSSAFDSITASLGYPFSVVTAVDYVANDHKLLVSVYISKDIDCLFPSECIDTFLVEYDLVRPGLMAGMVQSTYQTFNIGTLDSALSDVYVHPSGGTYFYRYGDRGTDDILSWRAVAPTHSGNFVSTSAFGNLQVEFGAHTFSSAASTTNLTLASSTQLVMRADGSISNDVVNRGTITLPLALDMSVAGNYRNYGALVATSSRLIFRGNYINAGTQSLGTTSVVSLLGASSTLSGNLTGSNRFNDLTVGGTYAALDNASSTGDFMVTSTGSFTAPPILGIGDSFELRGSFDHATGTVHLSSSLGTSTRYAHGGAVSFASLDTSPSGFVFKGDGTRLYVLGEGGDAIDEVILKKPWVLSSATTVGADTFSVAAEELTPKGLFFKPDGTRLYVIGSTGSDINEYILDPAWDLSSAVFYSNFSVAAQETTPEDIAFSADGTRMYVLGSTGDDINEYSLSTPWNLVTLSAVDTLALTSFETALTGMSISSDGSVLLVTGTASDNIVEFNLTTPWDVSTGVRVSRVSIATYDTLSSDVEFGDGRFEHAYVLGTTDDSIDTLFRTYKPGLFRGNLSQTRVLDTVAVGAGREMRLATTTILNTLDVAARAEVDMATSTLRIIGSVIHEGVATSSTGTMQLESSNGVISGGGTFGHTSISGDYTLQSDVYFDGDVVIDGGFTASSTLVLSGDYTNIGTASLASSSVILRGSSLQVATGTLSGASAFNNLAIENTQGSGATTQSVTFGAPLEVDGTFTMLGSTSAAFLSGATTTIANISIPSANANTPTWLYGTVPGEQWYIVATGTIGAARVKDSNACAQPLTSFNGTDNGNNTCWNFDAIELIVTGTLYDANGTTPITTSPVLKIAAQLDSLYTATTTSNGSGYFSFAVPLTSIDDIDAAVVVYTDATSTIRASSFLRASAEAVTIDLRRNAVIVSDGTGIGINQDHLASYDATNDADIQFNASSTNNSLVVSSAQQFIVGSSTSLALFGTSTLSGGLNVRGSLTNYGQIRLTGSGQRLSGTLASSSSLGDVYISGSYGIWNTASATVMNIATSGALYIYKPLSVGSLVSDGLVNASTTQLYLGGGASLSKVPQASYLQVFSTAVQDTLPTGVRFSKDGTKMYSLGDTNNRLNEYRLTTPWSVSSASHVDFLALADSSPQDLAISDDGTKLYIMGVATNQVRQYALSTPWDISTGTQVATTSISGLDTAMTAFAMSTNGSRMYLLGTTNDTVYQWSLATPWNVSTAQYDNISYSVTALESLPTGLAFSDDGRIMSIVGSANDTVYNFVLKNPWDISTAQARGSFSVTSQETVPSGLTFGADGSRLYVTGSTGDDVNEYVLSVPYSVTMTDLLEKSVSVFADVPNPEDVALSSDSSRAFILSGTTLREYNLTVPGDLSTLQYVDALSVGAQESTPKGFTFSPSGFELYVTGISGDSVYQYTLNTAFDVSTAVYTRTLSIAAQQTSPQDLVFSKDGARMVVVGTTESGNIRYLNEYALATPWDISTAALSYQGSHTGQSISFNDAGTEALVHDVVTLRRYRLANQWTLAGAAQVQTATIPASGSAMTFYPDRQTLLIVTDDTSVATVNEYQFTHTVRTATSTTASSTRINGIVSLGSGLMPGTEFTIAPTGYLRTNQNLHLEGDFSNQGRTQLTDMYLSLNGSSGTLNGSLVGNNALSGLVVEGDYVVQSAASTTYDVTISSGGSLTFDDDYSVSRSLRNYGTIDFAASGLVVTASSSIFNSGVSNRTSLTKALNDTFPEDVVFNPTGTKMYVLGSTDDAVDEYALATPWLVTSAVYTDTFLIGVQELTPTGIAFNNTGTKLYVIGSTGDDVNEYNLSVAWDVSTGTFVDTFSVAVQEGAPAGMAFNADGSKLYVIGFGDDEVNEYTLAVPWDVSTGTFVDAFSVASQTVTPTGMTFLRGGSKLLVISASVMYEYTLSTPWDVSSAIYQKAITTSSLAPSATGITVGVDPQYIYAVGSSADTAVQIQRRTIPVRIVGNYTGTEAIGDVRIGTNADVYLRGVASTTHVTIGGGSWLDLGTSTLSVSGNYVGNGGLSASSSRVVFNGASPQSVTGSLYGDAGFNELVVSNRSGDGATTQSVTFGGALSTTDLFTMLPGTSASFKTGATSSFATVTWQGNETNQIWLYGENNATRWGVTATGTIDWVNVKDSNACGSPLNSVNGLSRGNNRCWSLPMPQAGTLTLAPHTAGQVGSSFTSAAATNATLFAFRLTPSGEEALMTDIAFALTGAKKLAASDFSNVRLFTDTDGDRLYDAGETQVGGAGSLTLNGSQGSIQFAGDFNVATGTNYIVTANWNAPPNGSFLNVNLQNIDVDATGYSSEGVMSVTGGVPGVQHNRNNKGGGGGGSGAVGGDAPAGGGIVGGGGAGGGSDVDTNTGGGTIGNESGFLRPNAQSGSWNSPNNAYDGTDGTYATTSSANTHTYNNNNFGIPGGNQINGIAVKLEIAGTQSGGTVNVQLSWDGGSSWTEAKTSPTLQSTDTVYTIGGASDLWGRAWQANQFTNENFRVRLTGAPSNNIIKLDAIQVRVYNQTTGGGGGGGGEI